MKIEDFQEPTRPDRADSLPGDAGRCSVSAPETVTFGSPGTGRQSAPGSALEEPYQEPGFEDMDWVLPVQHLSVSQLNMFLRCERSYQQKYILHDRAPASHDQVLGSAVHGAVQFGLTHDDFKPVEVADYFREFSWPNAIEDQENDQGVDWHDEDPAGLALRGEAMVQTYMTQVAPRLQVSEIEKRFELHLPAVPVPIIGYVDITQTGTRPAIDIKTSSKAQNTILPTWLLQGRVYQLVEERPIDWHVITKQSTPQVITSVESPALLQPYSEIQGERTKVLVERLAWRINHTYRNLGEHEDWDWTGIQHTFACKRCHWRGNCPGWEGVDG